MTFSAPVTTDNCPGQVTTQLTGLASGSIEVPGRSIKSTGNYKVLVRLYEKEEATIRISIAGQEIKAEVRAEDENAPRRRERAARRRVEEAEPTTLEEQAAAFEAAVSAGRMN